MVHGKMNIIYYVKALNIIYYVMNKIKTLKFMPETIINGTRH